MPGELHWFPVFMVAIPALFVVIVLALELTHHHR